MCKCFITLLWQMFYNIIRVKCFQWNNRKMSKQTSSDSKRSCHGGCSIKEGVFKNFANFTGSHVCQSLFFNTVVVKLSNCIMVVNLFFFFFFFLIYIYVYILHRKIKFASRQILLKMVYLGMKITQTNKVINYNFTK